MNLFHGFTLCMYVCAYINTNIKQKRKRKGKQQGKEKQTPQRKHYIAFQLSTSTTHLYRYRWQHYLEFMCLKNYHTSHKNF